MKKTQVAVAVATALAAGSASAASEWTLTALSTKSNNGTAAAALSGTLTFSTGVGNSLEADGSFSGATKVGMTPLFTWNFGSDFVFGGTPTGSFSCTEGVFGSVVGASICGNYTFGANGYNESSYDGSSGTAVIGGDDISSGPAQSIASFAGQSPVIPPTDFSTILVFSNGTTYSGNIWTFTANAVVPVPAAAWLFGSALGLLGWVRRRATV